MHIKATVNPRLLTRSDRLFTGTLEGRIVELLQNARRAGAAGVDITNNHGTITIRDDGRGVEDFARMLDLGGSAWDEELEASEDPAGVGLFCLAPRELTIRSRGRLVAVTEPGWCGEPVEVRTDPEPVPGTVLSFADEPWTLSRVNPCAVFSGLRVTVDGEACSSLPFVSPEAVHHPELGCRIEIVDRSRLTPWHDACGRSGHCPRSGLLNFHGQVVGFDVPGLGEPGLYALVEMTGEPTELRLMLPARTQVVQNGAFERLRAVIEVEGYRCIERRGRHRLPFRQYQRALALGIDLPEAEPVFTVGLLPGDTPPPVQVVMPEGFPLARCHRLATDRPDGDDSDAANLHLLAALGTLDTPLVPVEIDARHDGYAWARLPVIGRVTVESGAVIRETWIGSGTLVCVESLRISATAEDGRVYSSPVCMAVPRQLPDLPWEERVLVTREAFSRLTAEDVWYHLGGWGEDGDTYETEQDAVADELARFWADLFGPHEHVRARVFDLLRDLPAGWTRITLEPDGAMHIHHAEGEDMPVLPPSGSPASAR